MPSEHPTHVPTDIPSFKPSDKPTEVPSSAVPSANPTEEPTGQPQDVPTTHKPTAHPTTDKPTDMPIYNPSYSPTDIPNFLPSTIPTERPSFSTIPPFHPPSFPPVQYPAFVPVSTHLPTISDSNSSYQTGYVYSVYYNSTPSCNGSANFASGLYYGWCWQLSSNSSFIQYIDLGDCSSPYAILNAFFDTSDCTGYYYAFFSSLASSGDPSLQCSDGAQSFCSSNNYVNYDAVVPPYAKYTLLEGDAGLPGFEGCSANSAITEPVIFSQITLDTCAYLGNSSYSYVSENVTSPGVLSIQNYYNLTDCLLKRDNDSSFSVPEDQCESFKYIE